MKEVLMSDKEYEEYKTWRAGREEFKRMKANGELFYIDIEPRNTGFALKMDGEWFNKSNRRKTGLYRDER